MKVSNLRIGVWYIVAGAGPMLLRVLPDPPIKGPQPHWNSRAAKGIKTTVTLRCFIGGGNYYASPGQIVREADEAYMNTYREDLLARRIVKNKREFPESSWLAPPAYCGEGI